MLVRRGQETHTVLNQSIVDNRWLMLKPFSLKAMQRWKEDMALNVRRDLATQRIVGYEGFDRDIVPYDFGGVGGVRDVVPSLNMLPKTHQDYFQNNHHYQYFGPLIDNLVERGAVLGRTLYGCPYDFRLFLDPDVRAAQFRNVQGLLEEARAQANGVPAVVVSHSLGGIWFKWFLSSGLVSPAWIAEHVHAWVCVNAPFGGTPFALKAAVCGDYYISLFSHQFIDELQMCSGVIASFPNPLGRWASDDLFLHVENAPEPQGLCMDTYDAWAQRHPSLEIWRDLMQPHLTTLGKPLDACINVHAVATCDLETPIAFKTKHERVLPYYTKYTHAQGGDGVVSWNGLEPMRRLLLGGPEYRESLWANTSHVGVLSDLRLARLVWKYAQ